MPNALVVDDQPIVREVLSGKLIKRGYDVGTAEDGLQALDLLADTDVLFTDINMPNLDGRALLKEVEQRCRGLAVVVLQADKHAQVTYDGPLFFLPKPYRATEYVELMDRIESSIPALAPQSSGRPLL